MGTTVGQGQGLVSNSAPPALAVGKATAVKKVHLKPRQLKVKHRQQQLGPDCAYQRLGLCVRRKSVRQVMF